MMHRGRAVLFDKGSQFFALVLNFLIERLADPVNVILQYKLFHVIHDYAR